MICPECEQPIPADAPGGICPACVIGLGLSSAPGGPAGINDATREMEPGSAPTRGFVAPRAADLNHLFEHLEVEELIGQGGMGAVYKARQVSLDRAVAVKILPPYAGNDPAFLERFQREARALAKLTHPNIVMVFEFGQVSEMFYFVMEYVDGVNLREAIEAGGLTTRESLNIVPQICEALQYAHDEGVVHRDIKPENIMLDSRGRVKIADFGLAKLLERNAVNFTLTSTNQLLGTIKYMAPEQIENPNSVDHRSDIYSLGVVFYELLTGELPLGRFDPPSATVPTNRPLDPVVMRTLEKQPANRYQNASEIKTAVESVVIEESVAPPAKKPAEPPAGKSARFASSGSSASKRMPAVHFQLQNVYAGFGRGKGLMRVDWENQELILDLEIKDFLGGLFRSEFKQVRIEFDHILSLDGEFAWYSTPSLNIQTDYFQEFATLAGAENGRIRLVFDSKDKKSAVAICDRVRAELGLDESELDSSSTDSPGDTAPFGLNQKLTIASRLILIGGIVDLVFACIFLVASMVAAVSQPEKIADVPQFLFGSLFLAIIGFAEIYFSRCLQSFWNLKPTLIGLVVASILFFHLGAVLVIPMTLWLLVLFYKPRYRKEFAEQSQRQQDDPGLRSDVFSDPAQRTEFRQMLKKPLRWLLVSSLVSLTLFVIVAGALSENIRADQSFDTRFPALIACALFGGVLGLPAYVILQLQGSLFWANLVARVCRVPFHLLFPVNFWIGRRIQKRINDYQEQFLGANPYVDKSEPEPGT